MLILLLVFVLISMISGYCETGETLIVKHNYELGCKPIKAENGHIQRLVLANDIYKEIYLN